MVIPFSLSRGRETGVLRAIVASSLRLCLAKNQCRLCLRMLNRERLPPGR